MVVKNYPQDQEKPAVAVFVSGASPNLFDAFAIFIKNRLKTIAFILQAI